ncbi:amino acid ABC transporter permease [Actinocorallia longicatena]|uniref:Amino acid ABC transporter permease n=1 Tax=Actinocorallia longicatena TaxID=111803 RepID=A0ABP6QN04_9ACTN
MSAVWDERGRMLAAFLLTLKLAGVSAIGSLLLGTVLVSMRVSPIPVLRWSGAAYVNLVRNTPLTLVLLFCGLGLGTVFELQFGDDVSVTTYWLAIIGLTAYTATFVCEVLRAGINTVPVGQSEAARSLGFTFRQNLTLVVLPQAFRSVVGPLGSVLIALTKNTTVAAVIGGLESANVMKDLINAHGDASLPIFAGFALMFVLVTLPTGIFFGWLAKRVQVLR